MQRSSVLKYILKRLVMAIFVLFLVSVIIFIAIRLAPGDPVLNQLGPYGERTPEREAAVRAQLGLDKSYVEQYFIWIGNVFRGNFGVSLKNGRPVLDVIMEKVPASLELVVLALVVSLTLVVTVAAAKFIGCTLPLLAKKIGFDPAVMASPLITTIVDALALLTYFGIASSLLHI